MSVHKKRIRNGIIAAVVLLVLILGVFVCMKYQIPRKIALRNPDAKTIQKDVTRYLEKRYDEEFTIVRITPPSVTYSNYYRITAYPSGVPRDYEHQVGIQGWLTKDGLITYYDNYPLVKLIPELSEYISDIVGEYFPENKIYISIFREWYDENLDTALTLEEFLNDTESSWRSALWGRICIPCENQNESELLEDINRAVEDVGQRKISGFFMVYLIYNNYDQLPVSWQDHDLGKYEKDFVNYDYYICRDGTIK